MAITANVQKNRTVVGSVSQGNQPQVTRVTVPGPAGPTGASGGKFTELSDVDASGTADGALIQYNGVTEKFEVTTTIETETGEIRLNGGTF